jgi:hypothetical protein
LAVITAILCGFLFWKKRKTKRVGDIVHHSRHDDSQPCSREFLNLLHILQ